MAYDFHVGMRVVAIGGGSVSIPVPPSDAALPRRGTVYTIRQICPWPHILILLLEELDNRHLIGRIGTLEPGFDATSFRPVDETKLDIFRKLLAPVPSRAKELA